MYRIDIYIYNHVESQLKIDKVGDMMRPEPICVCLFTGSQYGKLNDKQSPAYQIVYFDGIKNHKKCGLRLCFQHCTHSL